jgi:hypothetical protein
MATSYSFLFNETNLRNEAGSDEVKSPTNIKMDCSLMKSTPRPHEIKTKRSADNLWAYFLKFRVAARESF